MELINGKKVFKDIQQEFNDTFPFLKIEYLIGEQPSEQHRGIFKIETTKRPSSRKLITAETIISINDDTTVAGLVKMFMEKFEMAIRVFRKSDNMWIEISLTDSWTLVRQNNAGSGLNAT